MAKMPNRKWGQWRGRSISPRAFLVLCDEGKRHRCKFSCLLISRHCVGESNVWHKHIFIVKNVCLACLVALWQASVNLFSSVSARIDWFFYLLLSSVWAVCQKTQLQYCAHCVTSVCFTMRQGKTPYCFNIPMVSATKAIADTCYNVRLFNILLYIHISHIVLSSQSEYTSAIQWVGGNEA